MGNIAYRLNVFGLAGIAFALYFALAWQITFGELPCPLCTLQRAGFAAAGLGLLLNVRFDTHPAHYGAAILGAGVGAATSLRQVLLHIVPGSGAYGSALSGYHFYTSAFVGLTAIIGFCALLLLLGLRDGVRQTAPRALAGTAKWAVWAFVAAVALVLAAGFPECGFGPCPDDPTGYWLLGTGRTGN